ncbi:hypothetical protein LAZ67_15001677 [Cordylochernes scorpioides]|uniref:CCHC-type domain-containing protein n=1 Tax=Cordylochernes scorpioides TaxID=51811 RepID=A0ABY6LA13_9ARAC|nr:hypothetical protein LAZ67_15001677 [Cordylochernes scorpioides]
MFNNIARSEKFNFKCPEEWITWARRFEHNICQYFIGRRNIIFDRAQFNKRSQKRCSYGELKEELIRDTLVVGVRNLALSEKLQLIPDLTMDKAIEIAKQTEAQNKGNFSKIKGSNLKHDESSIPDNSKAWYQAEGAKACTRCGSPKFHKFEHCPAFNATCRRCSKKGHFMKQCKTKLVSQVTTKDDNEKFLGNFCIDQFSPDERWNCKVAVNKRIMPFKINTGADVSVMPENCFKQNFSHQLGKTQKRLYAAGMAMPVLGNIQATLEANGKVSHEYIYVVKNLHVSLLSAKASEELLDVNSNPLTDPLKDYPELFSGLEKLNKPYKIELNDQAQPYAIHTPRRIPFPLMNKTKQKLKEMEEQVSFLMIFRNIYDQTIIIHNLSQIMEITGFFLRKFRLCKIRHVSVDWGNKLQYISC